MGNFDLASIIIVAALGIVLVAAAVWHHRSLKKAVDTGDKRHVRGLRRYRH
ncbi:hypothetical protein [Herbaspirillum sp. alder98]|uniref:hypothetical protein n=1 Tax=Herbaspirillum sp. alder98 TaxID=2913096 RepID=UPI001CD835CE|nr:hypothetical protein [Herbaspirillum sp. alder98]MCA1326462.1 hypothetical protein [Herbaspirillum sp. alder98]